MKPTRQTQPYRTSGSRAPSQVLDTMRAGRAAGAQNPLMAAYASAQRKKRGKGVRVPRTTPQHKRRALQDELRITTPQRFR